MNLNNLSFCFGPAATSSRTPEVPAPNFGSNKHHRPANTGADVYNQFIVSQITVTHTAEVNDMHLGLHNSHLCSYFRATEEETGQKTRGAEGERDVRFRGNHEPLYETLAV